MTAPSQAPLTPEQHVRLLHPQGGFGRVAVGPLAESGRVVDLEDACARSAAYAGHDDVYISQQRFRGWRAITRCTGLSACYADLDYYTLAHWAGCSPEQMTALVLEHLAEHGVPAPSFILSSGRGLQLVWLHDRIPMGAQRRWNAVQRTIGERLQPFAPDPSARHAATVLRLAGTRNSKSGALVRTTYLPRATRDGERWSFDDLAHEILPVSRAELDSRTERYKARTASRRVQPRPIARSGETYWRAVVADLERLAQHRWPGGIPPGQRNAWMFIVGTGLAWIYPAKELEAVCRELCTQYIGWSQAAQRCCITSILTRAKANRMTRSGANRTGQSDRRYKMTSREIIARLSITSEEMTALDLQVLLDTVRRRERERLRGHRRRRAAGRLERCVYLAQANERRGRIAELRQLGGSWRSIAAQVGISESEVRRLAKTLGPLYPESVSMRGSSATSKRG